MKCTILVEYDLHLEPLTPETIVEPGDRIFRLYLAYRGIERYKEVNNPFKYYNHNLENMKNKQYLETYRFMILKHK